MDTQFVVLQQKEVYEFLEGSGNNDLELFDGQLYGMPYLTGTELYNICNTFGVTDIPSGSRWTYVEALIKFAIENDRCDELLRYLFALARFKNLQGLPDMATVEKLHNRIVSSAVQRINQLIRLTRKELMLIKGHFYITDIGTQSTIMTSKVDSLTSSYVHGLIERCEADLVAGNYDSVVTKSRTMVEEILIQILEQNGEIPSSSGKIGELYNQVKTMRNMQQSSLFDNRVNGLLSGLEKIVQNIGEMRNENSDAHGVGRGRIRLKEKEARLIMNSAITFCEYIL